MSLTLAAFTDGACSGNPGPGGWGVILVSPEGKVRELGGGEARTTNNRMELTAAIAALRALKALPGPLAVYTDSTYVITGITSWVRAWKRKGWTTSSGGAVLNRDLWEELDALAAARGSGLAWRYVRGHSGVPGNERCDEIAVGFSLGRPVELYRGPLSGYGVDVWRLPGASSLPPRPQAPAKRPGGFYLSLLDGRLERHAAWADCQARVYGKPNARFKKVYSEGEAGEVSRLWGGREARG